MNVLKITKNDNTVIYETVHGKVVNYYPVIMSNVCKRTAIPIGVISEIEIVGVLSKFKDLETVLVHYDGNPAINVPIQDIVIVEDSTKKGEFYIEISKIIAEV